MIVIFLECFLIITAYRFNGFFLESEFDNYKNIFESASDVIYSKRDEFDLNKFTYEIDSTTEEIQLSINEMEKEDSSYIFSSCAFDVDEVIISDNILLICINEEIKDVCKKNVILSSYYDWKSMICKYEFNYSFLLCCFSKL